MGNKWSWGVREGGRSAGETVKHSSEASRKTSTSSTAPLFQLETVEHSSEASRKTSTSSMAPLFELETGKQSSEASRKTSTNSMTPLFELETVEQSSEASRKTSTNSMTPLFELETVKQSSEASRKTSTNSMTPLFELETGKQSSEASRKTSTNSMTPLFELETVEQSSEASRKTSTNSMTPLFELETVKQSSEASRKTSTNSMTPLFELETVKQSSEASRKTLTSSVAPLFKLETVKHSSEASRKTSTSSVAPLFELETERRDGRSLHPSAISGSRRDEEPEFVTSEVLSSSSKTRKWMYKNLMGVGLSFLLVFSAFQGLQNLQSTINAVDGLGLATLAIVYLFFTISGFVSPGLIRLLGTKYSLLGGFLCHLVYTGANYYPSWYTLVPASALLGFASGPIWAAANTHLVKVAVVSAPWLEMDQNHLISYMVGIFFGFFQGAQIPGNLVSSLIYFPYSKNETNVDDFTSDIAGDNTSAQHCGVSEEQNLDRIHLYILLAVYFIMISLGILTLLVLVDHFPIEREKGRTVMRTMKVYFGNSVIDLLKIMKDYKVILIIPLATVNGLEQAFIFGTVTQVIVADCFGTYLVGFALIVFGVTSAFAGMSYGQLVKCIPRYSLFGFGGLINIGVLIFLALWQPYPSYVAVFLVVFFWAIADAMWNTMTTSLVGILFPDATELAYSVQRIWQAIGLFVGFIIAEFLHLQGRCYFMLAAITIAVISNLVLEFKTQSKASLLPCCFKSASYSISSKQVSKVDNGNAKA